MKLTLFFLLAAFALAASSPVPAEPIKILRYETENKITRVKRVVKPEEGQDAQALIVSGSYSYPDPEGNLITLKFVVDKNGLHPEGAHIPVAPVV